MLKIETAIAKIDAENAYHHKPEGAEEPRSIKAGQRIHVLGQTSLGLFAAYSIASLPKPPPLTYLLHQPHRFQKWYDEGTAIEFMKQDTSEYRLGIDVEFSYMKYEADAKKTNFTDFDRNFGYLKNRDEWIIEKLLVATAPSATIAALLPVKARLGPYSTICLLDHGPGMVDKINRLIFPNPATRPRYILGMSTHGLHPIPRRFGFTQTAVGQISLSTVPVAEVEPVASSGDLIKRMDYGYNECSTNFIRTLARSADMGVKTRPYGVFLIAQWERHLVDSIMHPLSAIFGCNYSRLQSTSSTRRLIHNLLEESIPIILALPEMQRATRERSTAQNAARVFTVKRMEAIIYNRLRSLGENTSPMVRNMERGTKTEIDELNGYIVRRGEDLGIPTPVNSTVMEMVRTKQVMHKKMVESEIPLE